MVDELIDEVDENNKLTGKKLLKSEAHANGAWHRVVHVWMYSSKGNLFLRVWAKTRKTNPMRREISAIEHVSAGEDPLHAAHRKVKESLGVDAKKEDFEFLCTRIHTNMLGKITENEFIYVYLLKYNGKPESLKWPKEDVESMECMHIKDVAAQLIDHPEKYVPRGNYWKDMFNEIKKRTN